MIVCSCPQFPTPKLSREEGGSKDAYFRNLEDGDYLVKRHPTFASWDSHCFGWAKVTIRGGDRTVVLKVPSTSLKVSLRFEHSQPSKVDARLLIVRANKITQGKLDPVYCQWLICERNNGKWQGQLLEMEEGSYRMTMIKVQNGQQFDVASTKVEINRGILKRGWLTLVF